MERDPVCGMLIDKKDAAGMAEYEGKTYYFHTPECNAAFEATPEKYVRAESRGPRTKEDDPASRT